MTALVDIAEGDELAPTTHAPDPLDLFLYSAAVWLPHRIHYDVPHTTGVEGHPGLLVQGPLQGVYLLQLLTNTFGSAVDVHSFSFRHQVPVYAGQTLRCRGRVTSVDRSSGTVVFELWTELDDGRQATVAEAAAVVTDRS